MKKIFKLSVCLICLCLLTTEAFSQASFHRKKKFKKKKQSSSIQSEAGLRIPQWGIVVDAYYLTDLDNMIPGYRVLNILIQNNRPDAIRLHPAKDKWVITDHLGKKHKAYNHIKFFNRKLWDKMSDRAKNMLDYPHGVAPGETIAVDVFFKDDTELKNFREIAWHSDFFDKEFNIMTPYEGQLMIEYETIDNKTSKNKNSSVKRDVKKEKVEKDYREARDKYIANHEKDVKKVFYVTPEGEMKEIESE